MSCVIYACKETINSSKGVSYTFCPDRFGYNFYYKHDSEFLILKNHIQSILEKEGFEIYTESSSDLMEPYSIICKFKF